MPTAKQIPHEHFIMALSVLVIALSGVILTSYPMGAEASKAIQTRSRVFCADSNQINPAVQGMAALVKTDPQDPTRLITLIEKSDACIGRQTVREYYCQKNSVSIISKIIACPKDLICDNGACIQPLPVSPSSSSTAVISTQ